MDILFGLFCGLGLSAACGFRIFVPLLAVSIASLSGNLELAPDWAWMGSYPALITFAIATVIEVGAYYLPWIDNLLDVVATPTAIIAGTMITASFIPEMSPMLQWTLAAIMGGGAAGSVQLLTDVTRVATNVTTAGLGNPVVSTMELTSSTVLSILAIALPILGMILTVGVILFAVQKLWKRWKGKKLSDENMNQD